MNRKPEKTPKNTPPQQHKTISPMLNQNNIGNNAQNNPAFQYNPNIPLKQYNNMAATSKNITRLIFKSLNLTL